MSCDAQRILVGLCLTLACLLPVSSSAEKSKLPDGYAGTAACLDCHADQAIKGPHGAKGDPRSPAGIHGCESCHGPGAAHAAAQEEGEDEDPVDTLKLGAASGRSAKESSAVCLDCHISGHTALWEGSIHDRRDVSCMDCHAVHGRNREYLKAPTQTEVCSECHKDVRSQLMRTSHHPIREGKVECSDCHNPHGAVADKLVSANYVNEKCYECHAEKRGPFLWEHAPVTEDCMSCHTPHGSTHDNLLKQKVPYLCQTCHSNARHPGTLYALPSGSVNRNPFQALGNRAFYRSCQNCHSQVHGSNHPSGKTLGR